MKRVILLSLFILILFPLMAQEADTLRSRPKLTHELLAESRRDSAAAHIIDLPLGTTALSRCDMMPFRAYCSPWTLGGPGAWSLHEGLNAEVGFSVSAGFGKHSPKGAGFGEHFAAAYAMPMGKDKRWIGAFGIYTDRLDWGSYRRLEAGIAGVVGYHLNDWCNLYAYGTYNFVPGESSGPNPYLYGSYFGSYGNGCWDPYANLKARIGAAAQFKLSENSTFTVSFEHDIFDSSNLPQPQVAKPFEPKNFGGDGPGGAPQGSNGRRF